MPGGDGCLGTLTDVPGERCMVARAAAIEGSVSDR